MKKILFFTLYDNICLGSRILSAIAKNHGIETHLAIFKDQKTRPIIKDSEDLLSYQFYFDGIKYGSCYGAYNYTQKEIEIFKNLTADINPDLLCLSTRSFGYSASKEIIEKIKENHEIPVIGGGWGPTLEQEKFLEFCDYVCFGEGEIPIEQICNILALEESDYRGVNNLIYKENDHTINNAIAKPLTSSDLDRLPYPDFDPQNKYLIDNNQILRGSKAVNKKIYNCLAGRGCPLNCTYCMSSKYKELYKNQGYKIRKYRIRSVEVVIEELKKAKKDGAIYIRISDEIFPIWKNWIDDFIDQYSDEIDLPFFAYIRPEFHSEKVIEKLISIGMTSTVVAIQSGSERIRKKIFKRMLPKKKIIDFAKNMAKHKVEFTYHLINYNPFEKENEIIETIDLLKKLPHAPLVLFRLVTFEGTPLKKIIDEQSPKMLPEKLQKWYGYIYSMITKSAFHRKIGNFILEYKLFMNSIFVMTLIFAPTFINLHVRKLIKKIKYGSSTLLPIPIKEKEKKTRPSCRSFSEN
jgi:radical SAM superfamily enzyme YgiQ (UPF0313 family)